MLKEATFILLAFVASVFAADSKFEKIEIVDNLNLAWQQYVSDAMAVGKTPKVPQTYQEACKLLLDSKRIESIPAQNSVSGYILEIMPIQRKTAADVKFVAVSKFIPAKNVQENACKTQVANLNANWQMYIATKLAAGEKVEVPLTGLAAIKLMHKADILDSGEYPSGADYPAWAILWKKGDMPSDCKFEMMTRKDFRAKRAKSPFGKEWIDLCQQWRKYVADQNKAGEKIQIPENYEAACKLLKEKGYIESYSAADKYYPWILTFKATDNPDSSGFSGFLDGTPLAFPWLEIDLARLNAGWTQYCLDKMRLKESPVIPDDTKSAAELLKKEGLLKSMPLYIDLIEFKKAKAAKNCEFVSDYD